MHTCSRETGGLDDRGRAGAGGGLLHPPPLYLWKESGVDFADICMRGAGVVGGS